MSKEHEGIYTQIAYSCYYFNISFHFLRKNSGPKFLQLLVRRYEGLAARSRAIREARISRHQQSLFNAPVTKPVLLNSMSARILTNNDSFGLNVCEVHAARTSAGSPGGRGTPSFPLFSFLTTSERLSISI